MRTSDPQQVILCYVIVQEYSPNLKEPGSSLRFHSLPLGLFSKVSHPILWMYLIKLVPFK